MRVITKFQASNGVEFNTEAQCRSYEKLLDKACLCRKFIHECEDGNDNVGIPNTPEHIEAFKTEFRSILVEYAPDLLGQWDSNPRGIIGRYLSDRRDEIGLVLNRLYGHGILNVGYDGKSYGQPYFANKTKAA